MQGKEVTLKIILLQQLLNFSLGWFPVYCYLANSETNFTFLKEKLKESGKICFLFF